LYFDRHDGQAATVEDFVVSMEDASGRDLSQFRRWYKQSGTPILETTASFDEQAATYTLNFKQRCPDTPGQTDKMPFVIPIRLGLVGADGKDQILNSDGQTQIVFELTDVEQSLVIGNIKSEPVPSLLRGLSAPVKLHYQYSDEQLAHLMAHDSDGFNRWDATQTLSLTILQALAEDSLNGDELALNGSLIDAFARLLKDDSLDPAMVALMLQLPGEALMHQLTDTINPEAIHDARQFVREALAGALKNELLAVYSTFNTPIEYKPEADQIGRRSLKNAALGYLMLVGDTGAELAWSQFQQSDNMTDKAAALSALVNCPAAADYAAQALTAFEQQYRDEALVMNLWLQIQAMNSQTGGLARVEALMQHSAFTMSNPNKVRSLIGGFCNANLVNFHSIDGAGYRFLREQILSLNKTNPQVAARLVTPLTRWKAFAAPHSQLMRGELQVIADEPGLVKDIYEIATKSL
jgi:aminopeptidase N